MAVIFIIIMGCYFWLVFFFFVQYYEVILYGLNVFYMVIVYGCKPLGVSIDYVNVYINGMQQFSLCMFKMPRECNGICKNDIPPQLFLT